MKWDAVDAGVWVADTTRTTAVALEVFSPQDDDDGQYLWWAVSEGRIIGAGRADGLGEAQRQCELAAA